jgi:hypothetical protein
MGYHVSILRSANSKQLVIGLDEARQAASTHGWSFKEQPPSFEHKDGDRVCTLWYSDGELWTKSPEEHEINLMLTLASSLGARVRGDEYETYTSPEETYSHPDDVALQKEAEAESVELLRRDPLSPSKMRYYIIGFFVVLGVLAYSLGKWFER